MTPKDQSQSSTQSFEPPRRAETLPIGTVAASRLALLPTTTQARSVDLQINELILHGFSVADRHTIGEAVERELTRLLTEQGVPPTLLHENETAELDGGLLDADPTSNPDAIGAGVARAIYGGLRR
jgi:hypothetical protein